MTVEKLVEIMLDLLKQVQEMSGRPSKELTETDAPIGGLAGFDSLNGIEVTILLASSLKCEIPGDANLFISEDGRKALTISEAAKRIMTLLPSDRNDQK